MSVSRKRCPRCQEVKDTGGFYCDISNSDGLSGWCRPCKRASAAGWAAKNGDRKKAAQKALWKASDGRRAAAHKRAERWVKANPEKAARRQKAWASKNPIKVAEKSARYRQRHPDRIKTSQAKANARPTRKVLHADRQRLRRAVRGDEKSKITVRQWRSVLSAFNARCAYCGSSEQITIEHLTPLSRGGRNAIGNVAPACFTCNTKKGAKLLEEHAPDRASEILRLAASCLEHAG